MTLPRAHLPLHRVALPELRGLTCLWMILRRKSGFRLRHSRCPRRRDWLRPFTCSRMWGGGRRGGPLEAQGTQVCQKAFRHSGAEGGATAPSENSPSCPLWALSLPLGPGSTESRDSGLAGHV